MAWTAPLTAVKGNTFTAAQFNASIRDNLLETMPGKASVADKLLVATGTNSITERSILVNTVATSESTTSSFFTDLTTSGPAVTVNTGTRALVMVSCRFSGNTLGNAPIVGYEISGASSVSPSIDFSLYAITSGSTSRDIQLGSAHLVTGLTSGSNTFTLKYAVSSGGTATFANRQISVMAF